jgi:hypothetical protein
MLPEQKSAETADSSNDPDVTTGNPQPIELSQVSTPAPKQSHQKQLLVVAIAIVLIGVVAATYLLKSNGSSPKTVATKAITQQPAAPPQKVAPVETFFASNAGATLNATKTFSPATKKSAILNISSRDFYDNRSIASNQAVQLSKDGSVSIYTTALYDSNTNRAEGDSGILSTSLYVKTVGTETEIVKASNNQVISDQLITPDGSKVYYLLYTQAGDVPNTDLHEYNVGTKKDTRLKQDVFTTINVNRSPLTYLADGSLRLYVAAKSPLVTEYEYKNGSLTTRDLQVSKFCNDCRPEYGQPLSPDGKMLLMESGTVDVGFSYYVLDLVTGEGKQIYKPQITEQPRIAFWSPDSKQIAYDISANGSAGQKTIGLEFRFEILAVASGKIIKGTVDPSISIADANYSKHFVELLGWSPQGDYIAFANGGRIKIYNLADKSVFETGIEASSPFSGTGYGWYEK